MDVERTMEFILEQQAASVARQAKFDEQLAANEVKADRQNRAIRKIIMAGMRMVADVGQRQTALEEKMKETADQMKQLAESQRDTDAKFKQLMDFLLKQNKNGH